MRKRSKLDASDNYTELVSSPVSSPDNRSPSTPTIYADTPLLQQRRAPPLRSPKFLRLLMSIYVFTLWLTVLAMAFLLEITLLVLLFPLFLMNPRLKNIAMGLIFDFFAGVCPIVFNPFWHLVVVNPAPAGYKPSDTLIMVNHTSAVDAAVAARALYPWAVKFVFKGELLKIPIGGWALYFSGDIPLYFTKEKGGWGTKEGAVAKMMERVRELQLYGIGTVLFPEGTRSKTGGLQPFRDGFFRFAIEHKCEILPCVLHNGRSLWPLGTMLVDTGTVYFAFGKPTRPMEGETVAELKSRIRNEMITLQRLCPLFNPEAEKPLDENQPIPSRGQGISGNGTADM